MKKITLIALAAMMQAHGVEANENEEYESFGGWLAYSWTDFVSGHAGCRTLYADKGKTHVFGVEMNEHGVFALFGSFVNGAYFTEYAKARVKESENYYEMDETFRDPNGFIYTNLQGDDMEFLEGLLTGTELRVAIVAVAFVVPLNRNFDAALRHCMGKAME